MYFGIVREKNGKSQFHVFLVGGAIYYYHCF